MVSELTRGFLPGRCTGVISRDIVMAGSTTPWSTQPAPISSSERIVACTRQRRPRADAELDGVGRAEAGDDDPEHRAVGRPRDRARRPRNQVDVGVPVLPVVHACRTGVARHR